MTWALRSLGYRTDLFLARRGGVVEEKDRYVVVRTPGNPDFRWGNFLLYPDPPGADSLEAWAADFARELPEARARLLTWDRPDGARGDVEPFFADGYEIDESAILTMTASDLVTPPRLANDVEVERIGDDGDARDEGTRALVRAFAPRRHGSLEDLEGFITTQMKRYRALQARGDGQWFVARVDGRVAGVLGIVRQGEIGRFQLVGTDPELARRGVCSTLVHGASRSALEELGLRTLVMAADADYHAAKVYESCGFRCTERLVALTKKPPRC